MSSLASHRPGARAVEARLIGGILSLWLFAWALLTVSSSLAGGRPTASPVAIIDPAIIAAHVRADHGLVPWHLVAAYEPIVQPVFWLVLSVTCILVFSGVIAAVHRRTAIATWARRRAGAVRHPRRTGDWARAHELHGLRTRRIRPGAFVLGLHGRTPFVTQPETSVLVVGPTRSGKTSALVVPNLFAWRGPAVVTSTKSELVDITAAHRQSAGPVYVYDPTGEIGARYRTVTWTPLANCDSLDHAWRVAAWLCAGLQQGTGRGDNDWAHWAESGKLLIAPLMYAAAVAGRSIVDVQMWIHAFDVGTPLSILEDAMFDPSSTHSDDAARAVAMLTSVDQRPEKERGTVFSTVTRIFSVFNEQPVAASAAWNRFEPADFLARNGTLYLCTPRQSPERVSSLFVGLLMSVVTAAYAIADASETGRLDRELGLFLDELANIVPVEDLPALASQGAGRGVVLMSIVQDVSQLRARYGTDKAHSILNNHTCKVVLPGVGDPETADVLSRLVGQRTFTDVQVSRGSDGRVSRSYATRLEPLATPDALRQLHEGTAVVLYRGRPAAIIRTRPWYADRTMRLLSQRRYVRNAEEVRRAA